MELNWKEDNNLVRKLAKILLGDTLPNGEPVSSFLLLDDTSRAELQRWANMSDAEFAAAQLSGDSIRIDESSSFGIIISRVEIIHSGFGIVVVATIAEGVHVGDGACAEVFFCE